MEIANGIHGKFLNNNSNLTEPNIIQGKYPLLFLLF